MLLTVTDAHLDAKFLVDMLCQVLGGIDAAMLTAGATETEHQRGETTLDITAHMGISQLIHGVEERQDLAIILQETDHRLVKSRQLLIRLITTGVVGTTTVEHLSSSGIPLVNEKLNTRTTSGPCASYLEKVAGPSCGWVL